MLARASDSASAARPTAEPAGAAIAAGGGESPGLIGLLTSLPCVSEAVRAITTYDIGPVTQLLEQAVYFPMLAAPGGTCYRFAIATATSAITGRLVGRNRLGGAAASLHCGWRMVPDDYVGEPGQVRPLPAIPVAPHLRQRIEVFDWQLRFRDGVSGYRAYGAGHTMPGAGPASGAERATAVGLVLDVLEGFGRLAGLAGTVVASGTVTDAGGLELAMVTRFMDPGGGLVAAGPIPPPPEPEPPPGITHLAFLGQVDPEHPVKLRLSLAEGFLGSNVYELLQTAALDFDVVGGLRSRATRGGLTGSVSARLSFDPLTLCPMSPIQTRLGVFEFHDQAGRSTGALWSDMTEGRAFRSRLPGVLLPVYRFGGFGPIQGGTGEFTGARGILTMNSVISVQPRTLSNLYVLALEDPDGRYRAAAAAAGAGTASPRHGAAADAPRRTR
jgi:hypothetical protein